MIKLINNYKLYKSLLNDGLVKKGSFWFDKEYIKNKIKSMLKKEW